MFLADHFLDFRDTLAGAYKADCASRVRWMEDRDMTAIFRQDRYYHIGNDWSYLIPENCNG